MNTDGQHPESAHISDPGLSTEFLACSMATSRGVISISVVINVLQNRTRIYTSIQIWELLTGTLKHTMKSFRKGKQSSGMSLLRGRRSLAA